MKIRLLLFNLTLLVLISTGTVLAQLSEKLPMASDEFGLGANIRPVIMPEVDVQKLLAEDERESKLGFPFRFGYAIETNISPANSGTWEETPAGKIWFCRIKSSGAKSLNLIFNDYVLTDGAKLFVYTPDKKVKLGAFTSANNSESGKFATAILPGDELILELFEPAGTRYPSRLLLSKVIHGYKSLQREIFGITDFGESGLCNVNINCTEGERWQTEKRSIAMIMTESNTRICTGAMINNTRQDLVPYMLTGNHCFNNSADVETWIFYFNYESSGCDSREGPYDYTLQGSKLLASSAASDFALIRLNNPPPDSFKVHYAGWDRNGNNSQSHVTIHHPRGDIKKISIDNDTMRTVGWEGKFPGTHWEIAHWDVGTTERGSSGAPLFDENHRIIGQLHGGVASCANNEWDAFGKFSYSWDSGADSTKRLMDWLDPLKTNVQFLEGWDPTLGKRDSIPPTQIVDFLIIDTTSNGFIVTWTAPFDSTPGGVRSYDLRYSTTEITDSLSFTSADKYDFFMFPQDSGKSEMLEISGLNANTDYWLAIAALDRWGNLSKISNIVKGRTLGLPKMRTSVDSIYHKVKADFAFSDTITISNVSAQNSTLDVQFELIDLSLKKTGTLLRISPETYSAGTKTKSERGVGILGGGGPDKYGYRWIDSRSDGGPEFVWNDISQTGELIRFTDNDDGNSDSIDLGFDFEFYGSVYKKIIIFVNGYVSFEPNNADDFNNQSIPNIAKPNNFIAPFWDDLQEGDSGTVHILREPDQFTIQYTNLRKYSVVPPPPGIYTFQIVLKKNGEIDFYYKKIEGLNAESTIGLENSFGSDGLQIAYNSQFADSNLAVQIKYIPDWLTYTAPSGYIPAGKSLNLELLYNTKNLPAGKYSMQLKIVSNDTSNSVKIIPITIDVEDTLVWVDREAMPDRFELFQNYPNPFNPTTSIEFSLPAIEPRNIDSRIAELAVFDILGRKVRTLLNEPKSPGNHRIQFNAENLSSGVYFFSLKWGGYFAIRKMVLLR